MKTISIINLKGGSGKTTATLSVGAAFAKAGLRTLLIDMDSQADLSSVSFGDPDELPLEATVAVLFDEAKYVIPERLIVPTAFSGLWLVPCSELLRPVNELRPGDRRQYALREFLRDVAHRFDRVLIDNAPDLQFCAWAALTAADFVLTPVESNAKGFRGLKAVNRFLARVKREVNPELTQLGFVRTKFEERKTVHQTYSARIERCFPGLLLREWFPKAAQFEDADAARMPITNFKPRCNAAKAVERIAGEIEERIAILRQPVKDVA